MRDSDAPAPFFLVVADDERGVFAVEGHMTDDKPWSAVAARAQESGRRVRCGLAGADRDALAAEYREARGQRGVPPGSIVRPLR
jgi:hypothetical protein